MTKTPIRDTGNIIRAIVALGFVVSLIMHYDALTTTDRMLHWIAIGIFGLPN